MACFVNLLRPAAAMTISSTCAVVVVRRLGQTTNASCASSARIVGAAARTTARTAAFAVGLRAAHGTSRTRDRTRQRLPMNRGVPRPYALQHVHAVRAQCSRAHRLVIQSKQVAFSAFPRKRDGKGRKRPPAHRNTAAAGGVPCGERGEFGARYPHAKSVSSLRYWT